MIRIRHVALLAVILLALGLRLVHLSFQPLWWDEGWSLYFAATDVGTMLKLTAVDIHPPFYYLLLHFWSRLWGPGVLAVRMLSVAIGTLTVPLLFATGRRSMGYTGGLVAAFLLAISPFHIYYSQEVRMYGLVTLLGLAATASALRWEAEKWSPANWAGYVLAATAALYTEYYAGFLLLALNLIVLIRWLRRRRSFRALVSWLGAQAVVFLLFLPWLWYASGKLLTYIQFKVSVEQDPPQDLLVYVGHHLAALTWGHAEGSLAGRWALGLVPLGVLVLALAISLWRRSRGRESVRRETDTLRDWGAVWPFLVILAFALILGFVVNMIFPFNPPRGERLLLLALPAYLLFVSGLLVALWRDRWWLTAVPAAAYVAMAIVSLTYFYTIPRYPDDDYRPVAAQVRAQGLPSDAVIAIHPWQVGYLTSYIPDDDQRPTLVLTPRRVIPNEQQLWADDPALMAAELDALLDEHGRLWLLDHRAMGRVLEKKVEAYLVEHAYPTMSEWYGENTVLSLFSGGEPVTRPVRARFGEWLVLEGAAMSPGPLEAGWGVVATDLVWRLSERPGERYQVALRLVDEMGRVWAQRDMTPSGGLRHFFEWSLDEPHLDRHGLLVPAGTPPGDYEVRLQVYRSKDLAVLPVTVEGGSGGEVTLGSVRVVRPATVPPTGALSFEQPLEADFGERLRLLGYTVPISGTLLPGETVPVELFWQALGDPGEDFLPRLELLDAEDEPVAELVEKPVAGTYPTAWWRASELVRDPHALPIVASVAPGRYGLALSLIRAADGRPVETGEGDTRLFLAEIEVEGREHQYWPTVPGQIQVAEIGPAVELVGYDMREAVRTPGSPLEVTLYWHAVETPDRNYHVFVHLLDEEGRTVAQHDGPPGNGELPTLGWLPGEYLVDSHLLQLPFDLADGEYRLAAGLYEPTSGYRPGEPVILDSPVPVSASEGCKCR